MAALPSLLTRHRQPSSEPTSVRMKGQKFNNARGEFYACTKTDLADGITIVLTIVATNRHNALPA